MMKKWERNRLVDLAVVHRQRYTGVLQRAEIIRSVQIETQFVLHENCTFHRMSLKCYKSSLQKRRSN